MLNALTHWTNRVIEIKLRELDVTQRANVALLRFGSSVSTKSDNLHRGLGLLGLNGRFVDADTSKKSACWRITS